MRGRKDGCMPRPTRLPRLACYSCGNKEKRAGTGMAEAVARLSFHLHCAVHAHRLMRLAEVPVRPRTGEDHRVSRAAVLRGDRVCGGARVSAVRAAWPQRVDGEVRALRRVAEEGDALARRDAQALRGKREADRITVLDSRDAAVTRTGHEIAGGAAIDGARRGRRSGRSAAGEGCRSEKERGSHCRPGSASTTRISPNPSLIAAPLTVRGQDRNACVIIPG